MERQKLEDINPFLLQTVHNMVAGGSVATPGRKTLTFTGNDGHVVEALMDVG